MTGQDGRGSPADQPQGYRLSGQQELRWALQTAAPALRSRAVVRIEGLDPDKLRGAVETTVARHEILRTVYRPLPGLLVPVQVVLDRLEPAWDAASVLDPEHGPVMSVVVEDGAVTITTLPVTADAVALALVADELIALHEGAGDALSEDPLQYADFAEWQHETLGSGGSEAEAGRAHWAAWAEARIAAPRLPFQQPAIAEAPTALDAVAVEIGSATLCMMGRHVGAPFGLLWARSINALSLAGL
jgi:hypothetical protein